MLTEHSSLAWGFVRTLDTLTTEGSIAFPGDTAADDNSFGTGARAPLTIAAGNGGRYTIIVNSDDGFRFRILDNLGNPVTPGTLFVVADAYGGWFMGPGTCPSQ